jgi:uncharacterized membrane protein
VFCRLSFFFLGLAHLSVTGAEFRILDPLPEGFDSGSVAVSGDGKLLGLRSVKNTFVDFYARARVYTDQAGYQDLPMDSSYVDGMQRTIGPLDINPTGSIIVGTTLAGNDRGRVACFWEGPNFSEMQVLIPLSESVLSAAMAVDETGNSIAGYASIDQDGVKRDKPWVWTRGGDVTYLDLPDSFLQGTVSALGGMSRDGRRIAGWVIGEREELDRRVSFTRTCLWIDETPVLLPIPDDSDTSRLECVSGDGKWATGYVSRNDVISQRGVIWNVDEETFEFVEVPEGYDAVLASNLSKDGRFALGEVRTIDREFFESEKWVFNLEMGQAFSFGDFLRRHGIASSRLETEWADFYLFDFEQLEEYSAIVGALREETLVPFVLTIEGEFWPADSFSLRYVSIFPSGEERYLLSGNTTDFEAVTFEVSTDFEDWSSIEPITRVRVNEDFSVTFPSAGSEIRFYRAVWPQEPPSTGVAN